MELKDYWHTLRRRWKVVALCLFASVGVARRTSARPAQAATTVGAGMTNPASWAPGRSS